MSIYFNRYAVFAALFLTSAQLAHAQDTRQSANSSLRSDYPSLYAIVTVVGKAFSKKLKVEVELGETPDQINIAKEYADSLTNKKSYATILNFMAAAGFELVESRDNNLSIQGTGGTYNTMFILRKKRNSN